MSRNAIDNRTVIDVGCAALIRDGKVKVKQGCEIARLNKSGATFSDGSSLEADAIILAYVDGLLIISRLLRVSFQNWLG